MQNGQERIEARVRVLACGAVAGMLATVGTAHAQQAAEPVDYETVTRRLEAETARLNALQHELDEHRRQIESLRLQLRGRGTVPPGIVQSAQAGAESRPAGGSAPRPVGEAPSPSDQLPQTAQIFSEPTVLTPRGTYTLEPSLQYIHASNNRVALVGFTIIPAITIGLIDVRRVTRDAFYGAVTARYGLANRLEIEGKVLYVYSKERPP